MQHDVYVYICIFIRQVLLRSANRRLLTRRAKRHGASCPSFGHLAVRDIPSIADPSRNARGTTLALGTLALRIWREEDRIVDEGDFKIVLEELRAHFRGFGDSLKMTDEKVVAFRDEVRGSLERIDEKIWVLQADVTDLKVDVADLKVDVADLKVDVTDVKQRVTRIERTLNGARRRARRKMRK
jgi:hypothetical protein